ncbi:hypothetical protein D3C87_2177000 [compost metagenome]
MGEVEPALARQQKFAPHRGHGIKQMHRDACLGEHLGRHQPRGAASHDDGIAAQRGSGVGVGVGQGGGCIHGGNL